MDLFGECAKEILTNVPEVRGLMLVIDWEVGQKDFPPCLTIARETDEESLTASMRQTLKLLSHLSNTFKTHISKTESLIAKAEKLIQQQSATPESEHALS